MNHEIQLSMLARIQETQFEVFWNYFSAMYYGMIHGWLFRQGVQSQDASDILGCIEACQIVSRVRHAESSCFETRQKMGGIYHQVQ